MRKINKPVLYTVIAIVLIMLIAICTIFYRSKTQKKLPEINNLNRTEEANSPAVPIQQQPANTAGNDLTPKNPSSTANQAAAPAQPAFTKSSGNNGPVPVGVNINFVCTAEPGVDCGIVLDSASNKVVVGPAKVTDNGRGQYFASLYWTSVKGSYKVTAQAKNIQGGVSSSIVQTLEVQ